MRGGNDDVKDVSFSPRLDRAELETMLNEAEPQRKRALSSSISLSVAAGLAVSRFSFFDIAVIGPYVAFIVVSTLWWSLSNSLWRRVASRLIAPLVGHSYGQTSFLSGWEAFDLEDWLKDNLGASKSRSNSWRTQGVYRGTSYRLIEQSVRQPRLDSSRAAEPPTYHYLIEISVPLRFTGRVDIIRRQVMSDLLDSLTKHFPGSPRQVASGDAQFDQAFAVYVKDNDDFARLLNPLIMRGLLSITRENASPKLKAWFENGWFKLEYPLEGETFGNISLLTPMPSLSGYAETICWNLTIAQRLIDCFKGDYDGPLNPISGLHEVHS